MASDRTDGSQRRPPTPADVGRAAGASRERAARRNSPADLARMSREHYPGLSWLMEELGLDLQTEFERWLGVATTDAPGHLLAREPQAQLVSRLWRQRVVSGEPITLISALFYEYHISSSPSQVGAALGKGYQYDKTLHVSRQHVALALYDHAREVNWRNPHIFTRALELAHHYLLVLVKHEHLTNEGGRGGFTGRLGVSTVLSARFTELAPGQLEGSMQALLRSMQQGNDAESALPYLLEAAIRRFDQDGSAEQLRLALQRDEDLGSELTRSPSWRHLVAEAWLRLSDDADGATAARCLDRAKAAMPPARKAGEGDPFDSVRDVMLQTLLHLAEALPRGEPLALRGASLPFGFREWAESGSAALAAASESIAQELRASLRGGEPLRRALLADYQSTRGRTAVDENASIVALLEACEMRNGVGGQEPLSDPGNRYALAQDLLLLARIAHNEDLRRSGILSLLSEATATRSPAPVLLLARDVELCGSSPDLGGNSGTRCDTVANAVRDGDHEALFIEAAERALESNDLTRRGLGGRSQVVTVEDYFGIVNETFVIKATTELNLSREKARCALLSVKISEGALNNSYGLPEYVTSVGVSDTRLLNVGQAELITVRKFSRGSSLAEVLRAQPERAGELLERAAAFLAFIHRTERPTTATAGARRQVKTRELGRWLRDGIETPNWESLFDEWWAVSQTAGLLPRRDAHPENWLVSETGQVIAVDLESTGCRPFGYELAQLTDDLTVFAPDDWSSRRAVFNRYLAELDGGARDPDDHSWWRAYCFAVFARAVRGLTDPIGDAQQCAHAQALLRELPQQEDRLKDLCADVLSHWGHRSGLTGSGSHLVLTDGRRRRVSRAMAYFLRHDASTPLNDGGWVAAEVLAERISNMGERVSQGELLAVAGAIPEHRYEVQGKLIRARYGHSLLVTIDYVNKPPPSHLFHACPTAALDTIVVALEGLLPMKRSWVHLSDDFETALRAGQRHGPATVLSIDPKQVEALVFAGGATWLARKVPAQALAVVPLWQQWVWRALGRHETRSAVKSYEIVTT